MWMRDDIRAFAILAHIDHGKTTLSDRLLDLTGTIPSRQMREQFLDAMELEREKGITIKAPPIRMRYQARDGNTYTLYLIDAPGHVDFSYEVARSIAACEGAVLLVDATQGIEAQTLANAYLALEHGLEIIPVINKIDLPNATVEATREDLKSAFGFMDAEILTVSAKEGTGVLELLEAIVARVPQQTGSAEAPLRGLICDSKYDSYKGVLAYVRIVEGVVRGGERVLLMQTEKLADALEVGFFSPDLRPVDALEAGDVGYVATGLKTVADCRVGDTLTSGVAPAPEPLPGYRPAKPMVFAGFYPSNSDEYPEPWVKVTVITPATFVGNVMELVQNRRGTYIDMSYLDPQRAMLRYEMPLGEVIVDLHDQLKSRSQGYASMDYELSEYRAADVVRLDILIGGQRVDALSMIVHRDKSYKAGLGLVTKLKALIPRQLFEVAIQAAIGGKVISRATVQPLRKNVLAKCYGGDVTRKRKLLEKQKEGKKRLKLVGNVEIPQEAFLAVLRIKDEAASR